MPSRVMLLEEKAWKRCLKCGTRMFTTSSIRICPGCHRQNDRVLDRLARVACPAYVLERMICK
jgi:Zn finger protein HypA/HybF involved in hydrogenase expression